MGQRSLVIGHWSSSIGHRSFTCIVMTIPADNLRRQLIALFSAWGMKGEQVEITAQMLLAADLRGIDSHGIAILPLYDDFRRAGKLTLNPEIKVVRETPATA